MMNLQTVSTAASPRLDCCTSGLLKVGVLLLGWLSVGLLGWGRASAADDPPRNWQVLRLYVPEEQVDAVVTPDYLAIQLNDLQRLLAEEAQRRRQLADQPVGLDQAIYIARLEGQHLRSQASRWEVTMPASGVLDLARPSFAIEDQPVAGFEQSGLSSALRTTRDGQMQLMGPPQRRQWWFAFSARAQVLHSQRSDFNLALPRAALGLLLVAVPDDVTLTGDVPVARADTLDGLLPEDWPREATPGLPTGHHWHAVLLSGRASCALRVTPTRKPSSAAFDTVVESLESEYQLAAAGLQATARFKLGPQRGDLLRVRVEHPLKVRSIRVNDRELADWFSSSEDAQEPQEAPASPEEGAAEEPAVPVRRSQVVEVPLGKLPAGSASVWVDAVAPLGFPVQSELPVISVARGFVLDGRGLLKAGEGVNIEDVTSSTERLSTTEAVGGVGAPTWQWQWAGAAPRLRVQAVAASSRWSLKTLTRVAVQSNGIAATAHLRLAATDPHTNQTRLELAQAWFIDNVSLEEPVPGFAYDVVSTPGQGDRLHLRWDHTVGRPELRLIINAHFPIRTEADSLLLPTTQLVQAHGGRQEDVVVIESLGRYQLQLTPQLLRLRVREEDLLDWQRNQLPRLADLWLFRSSGEPLPTIQLEPVRSTLATRLLVNVEPLSISAPAISPAADPNRPQDPRSVARYLLHCQPISGSIDQVQVLLPLPKDAAAPLWSFAWEGNAADSQPVTASSTAISTSSGDTRFRITLSQPVSRPFLLRAELPVLARSGLMFLPLPSTPQALTQEAWVSYPLQLALQAGNHSVEILSPGVSGSGVSGSGIGNAGRTSAGTSLGAGWSGGSIGRAADMVQLRYDSNVVSSLTFEVVERQRDLAWVDQATHQHWLLDRQRQLHLSVWQAKLPGAQRLEVSIPSGWRVEELWLNRQRTSPALSAGGRVVTIDAPAGRSVTVALKCSSRTATPRWATVDVAQPRISLPELHSESVAWLPASHIAWQGWDFPAQDGQWWERYDVGSWWRWIAWDPWRGGAASPLRQSAQTELLAGSNWQRQWVEYLPEWIGNAEGLPLHRVGLAVPTHGGGQSRAGMAMQNARGAEDSRTTEVRDGEVAQPLWMVPRTAVAAWALVLVLSSVAIAWGLAGRRLRLWLAVGMLGLASLAFVPLAAVPLLQVLLLGWLMAGGLRLAAYLIEASKPVKRRSETALGSTVHLSRAAGGMLLFIAGLLCPQSVVAQEGSQSTPPVRDQIFGVLIPVDAEMNVAGEYVYVPTRLSRMLSSPAVEVSAGGGVFLQTALYSLRISVDPLTQSHSISEVTAEFRLEVTQADSELTLPLASGVVQVVRAYHDGQEVTVDPRLRQTASGLRWKAAELGRHTLRIVFRPLLLTQRDNRASFSVPIPPLPSAKLELLGDDLREVTVESLGIVQSESPRFMSAWLGPVKQLALSWPRGTSRVTDISQVQVFSDTWLHAHPDHMVAMCQLRITGASALPETLRILGDANWQPVGSDWHGARLLKTELGTGSSRPTYSVARPTDAGDALTIRVLLLPRDEATQSTLSLPFLSLQESAPLARTLAVSNVGRPKWKRVGTDNWQTIPSGQVTSYWESQRLAEQPVMLRVPAGTLSASLQRLPVPALPEAEETTEVSLQSPLVRVRYAAHWSQPLVGQAAVRLLIPDTAEVSTVLVDGLPTRHSILAGAPGAGRELVALIDAARGGAQTLELQLTLPAVLGRPERLPRVVLRAASVTSSIYQLQRGTELNCQLRALEEGEIAWEQVDLRPSIQLLNLQTPIGQANLGSRFRESPELPVEALLTPSRGAERAIQVMKLLRTEQGWKVQLECEVQGPQTPADFVFFDCPSSIVSASRDAIDTNLAYMILPSADSSRALLCVMPQTVVDGRTRVSITLRLAASGTSQSITLPDIRVLATSATRPVVALPNAVGGVPVRWTQGGRALPADWLERQGISDMDVSDCDLFELDQNQTQAVWQARRQEEQTARVWLTQAVVSAVGNRQAIGEVHYWVEPRNQMYLHATLPEGSELVGAEIAGRAVTWSLDRTGRVRILLQPNHLPLALTLAVRWRGTPEDPEARWSLALPTHDADVMGATLVGLRSGGDMAWRLGGETSNAVSGGDKQAQVAVAWGELLQRALGLAADRGQAELAAWLPMWSPEVWRLQPDTVLPLGERLDAGGTADTLDASTAASRTATVRDVWDNFVQRTGFVSTVAEDMQVSAIPMELDSWQAWPAPASGSGATAVVLELDPSREPQPVDPWRWALAACLVVLAVGVGAFPGRWGGALSAWIADQQWPLWVLLALATLGIAPVVWPAWILACCAVVVILRRLRAVQQVRQARAYSYASR
jgi:hypothetical protein